MLIMIILVIIIVLVIGACFYYFYNRNENMQNITVNGLANDFLLREDRYGNINTSINKKCNCNCGDDCQCIPGNSCGCECGEERKNIIGEFGQHCKGCNVNDGIDWRVKYQPGANNSYQDLMWLKMSPRKILVNNCTDCSKYGKKSYNAPNGYSETNLPENYKEPFMLNEYIYPENEECLFSSSFSDPRNNGIVPIKPSCVHKKISESHDCLF